MAGERDGVMAVVVAGERAGAVAQAGERAGAVAPKGPRSVASYVYRAIQRRGQAPNAAPAVRDAF